MNESLFHSRRLLGSLLTVDQVLTGFDSETTEWYTLGTVSCGQNPSFIEDATPAHVTQRYNGWQAPLKRDLVRKLARIGIAATDDTTGNRVLEVRYTQTEMWPS